jgi:hypothetical protein
MPLTPPPPSSPAPGKPPGKQAIFAPPRSAVPLPGSGSVFGRGFFRRLRESGGGAFLLVFIAAGGAIFLFGLAGTVGPYKEGLRANGDPRFFLAAMAFGTVFVLMAARMLQVALTGAEQESRRKGLKGDKSAPWTWDYPWKPRGMPPDYTSATGGSILGRIAFFAFLGLLNVALAAPSWLMRGIVLLIDLFGLVILLDSLRALVQWLRFRQPVVAWKTFPAFLGERLEATVRFPRALHVNGPARATLRCVQDEWTARPAAEGESPQRQLEPYAIHTEEHEVPVPAGRLDRLDLVLDVPNGFPGTNLMKEEAVYWQLLLQVPTPGPDFEAVFLVPVYRKG